MSTPSPSLSQLSPTSMGLIEQAKNGDSASWTRLVRNYAPLIYVWCRKSHLSPHDSADVMQDVFISVLKSLSQFRKDGPQHRFRGWLYTITHTRILDHLRQAHRQTGHAQLIEGTFLETASQYSGEPDADFTLGSLFDHLVSIIETEFEPRTWQAFWRFTVEGQPSDVVARDLGITANTVRKYKSRVLHRLRREFGDL